MVIITDHMIESLVVMKHELCWTLEDVTYLSLKVSHGPKAKKLLDPISTQALNKFNWADRMLFDHFNSTLWAKFSTIPNSATEVHTVDP